MSLFDSFDPNSEELIQVTMQRSFQRTEDFPEVVIAAFKEDSLGPQNNGGNAFLRS